MLLLLLMSHMTSGQWAAEMTGGEIHRAKYKLTLHTGPGLVIY